jgi:copper oxidase (laccase) domain-containing protein
LERVCEHALKVLCEVCGCGAEDVLAYVGPHIGAADFEVSAELAHRFARSFGAEVTPDVRHVDLGRSIEVTLAECGVDASRIAGVSESVFSCPERFFSYRASGGVCGRHGALAIIDGDCTGGGR